MGDSSPTRRTSPAASRSTSAPSDVSRDLEDLLCGGADPRWRRDGRELYFIAADGKMMAASVTSGRTFSHGPPAPLFATGIEVLWQDTRNHYDVTRDGQKFIVLVPDDRRYGPVTAIRNWQR
jgi:hypothetical protein